MFWIHVGGWQVGDKGDVALNPDAMTERGFVFVSTNYRLLPDVEMDVLIRDVAKSLGWVHRNIAAYGNSDAYIVAAAHRKRLGHTFLRQGGGMSGEDAVRGRLPQRRWEADPYAVTPSAPDGK